MCGLMIQYVKLLTVSPHMHTGKITVTLQAKAAYGDFTVRKFTIQEEKVCVWCVCVSGMLCGVQLFPQENINGICNNIL